ncbi:amidohydrolase [Catellatospora tritici]|uniref:amidohydrolase n=1 Tax=Catellatospora tritici TaxID=2851566 RepID=UPI001C2CFBAF|nr:amidohydrolase family protein [Catellatospora tritici]MBV1850883.1 amidohydrolase family protein [Catellatospora tritici]MBV1851136.1 amidohydrolase family protein [Catellatospora tritici]
MQTSVTPLPAEPTTLWCNAVVRSPADPAATAMLTRGQTIVWLGPLSDAPSADVRVDLGGALVTPAFVDAHVHATDTGLALAGLDLSAVRSATDLLKAVSGFADGLGQDAVVLGHGFDESTWGAAQTPPTAVELDRAAGGRSVYLSQASIHSALVSSDLLALAVGVPGYDASGWVRRDAHHVVRERAFGQITTVQRQQAQVTALRHAASLGIAAVHECGGPGTSSETDFTDLLRLSGQGLPEVYGFWGELLGAAKARELGAVGAGGDLYADGALGSRTAHVTKAYLDGEQGCGHGYVTAEQVRDHLLDCHAHRMQGGFHAIGDEAISTVVAGFAMAEQKLGVDAIRDARHRVEHAEIMDKRLIAAFVEFGIVASMQPAFDRLWGGTGQMYAQRLGVERSLASNPMGQMHNTGVALAFGSDSPVTPLDPWGSVRAAVWHFNPQQRMSPKSAFAAHTRGGWRSVHRDGEGVLVPGAPATFAVWRAPAGLAGTLPMLGQHDELPVCVRTVLRGETIYAQQ